MARACACRCTALGLSVGAVWRSRAGRLPCRVRCFAGVSGFPGGPTLCVWEPGSAMPRCVGLAARPVAPGPRHVGAPSRDPFPGPRGSAGLRPAGAGLCSGSVPLSGAAVSVACLVGLHVNSPSPRLTAGTLKVWVHHHHHHQYPLAPPSAAAPGRFAPRGGSIFTGIHVKMSFWGNFWAIFPESRGGPGAR